MKWFLSHLQGLLMFVLHIFRNKNMLFTLAYEDFRRQYMGSYLGLLWAVIRPLVFILTVYFIFSVGFKKVETNGVPFILYLMCGYTAWFFFAESVTGCTNSVVQNGYLVRKVNFRVSILPVVKIISALFLHMITMGIYFIVSILNGFYPNIYWLQLPLCTCFLIIFLLGFGWLLSALRVFIKDVSQVIAIILQLGFWVTPIFWSFDRVPDRYRAILELNPMVFIIQGYRNSLVYKRSIIYDITMLQVYCVITFVVFVVGALVFRKLRPHFGELL